MKLATTNNKESCRQKTDISGVSTWHSLISSEITSLGGRCRYHIEV